MGKRKERSAAKIPEGAILADLTQQVPNNSYSPPPLYYVDLPYRRVDCGHEEVWTASQQKWYFEIAKGSLYSNAKRCLDCRNQRRALFNGQGDSHPVKHLGTLFKRIRANVDPILKNAGFQFDRKTSAPNDTSLEYSRTGLILVIRYGRPAGNPVLSVECLDEQAVCHVVFNQNLHPKTNVLEEINSLTLAIQEFVRNSVVE